MDVKGNYSALTRGSVRESDALDTQSSVVRLEKKHLFGNADEITVRGSQSITHIHTPSSGIKTGINILNASS